MKTGLKQISYQDSDEIRGKQGYRSKCPGIGSPGARDNLLRYIPGVYLVIPEDSPVAVVIYDPNICIIWTGNFLMFYAFHQKQPN